MRTCSGGSGRGTRRTRSTSSASSGRSPTAAGLRLVAVTRHPELVPDGVEPFELGARSQELRMAWTLPRALRRLGASLSHTQHALPLRPPCPCVVTVHDVSFARDPSLMGWKDRTTFRLVVPRAVRNAARVLTVSERTKRGSRRALRRAGRAHRRHAERRRSCLLPGSGGARRTSSPSERSRRGRTSSRRSTPPRRSGCRSSSQAR